MDEYTRQKTIVAFLKKMLKFSEVINDAIRPICALLHSSTQTDVLEAIDFFVVATSSSLSGTEFQVHSILNLVSSNENAIREAVKNAFKMLYLADIRKESDAALVGHKLISLLRETSSEDLRSIEEILKHFVQTQEIPTSVMNYLWSVVKYPSFAEERVLSLHLLKMMAQSKPKMVEQNLNLLVTAGLGEDAENDFSLATIAFQTLNTINNVFKENLQEFIESKKPLIRLPHDHELVKRIEHLLISGIQTMGDACWVSMANSAVACIFNLIEKPVVICSSIHRSLCNIVSKDYKKVEKEDSHGCLLPTVLFTRYLSFCGHVAIHFLGYLKLDYFVSLRREENKKAERTRKSMFGKHLLSSPCSSSPRRKRFSIHPSDMVAGPVDEITTTTYIEKTCAALIKNEKHLVGGMLPIVSDMALWSLKHYQKELCAASSVALTKFMLYSEAACHAHLQLVCTLLAKAGDGSVRASLVVSLSDLMMAFPNVVEPWMPDLYRRLDDPEPCVRRATVTVLAHLVLHDFVRVKASITDIARCIVDADPDVCSVATYLFEGLSRKGNTVYNIVPDIISSLSAAHFSEPNFQAVLKYVLQYVEKEKLIEGLVEKLCLRFKLSSDCQLHELIYCLSLLKLNGKCLTKLLEYKNLLKEKLADPIVLKHLSNLSVKKNDARTTIELEAFRKELGL